MPTDFQNLIQIILILALVIYEAIKFISRRRNGNGAVTKAEFEILKSNDLHSIAKSLERLEESQRKVIEQNLEQLYILRELKDRK